MLSLTYLSSATALLSEEQLVELLAGFSSKNESSGLTGVLLYADGNFIQTIEGPDEVVEATFSRIERDPRHRGIIVALREQIDERQYPDWSMGFRALDTEQAQSLPGFNDYMMAKQSLIDSGRRLTHPEVFHRVFRGDRGRAGF